MKNRLGNWPGDGLAMLGLTVLLLPPLMQIARMPMQSEPAKRAPLSVLVLGDSIMAGKGQSVPWFRSLSGAVDNRAVSGYTSEQVLGTVPRSGRYDTAIVGVGRNDYNNAIPAEVYAANLRAILAAAPARERVLLAPPLKLGQEAAPQLIYNAIARQVAEETGSRFVDLSQVIPPRASLYNDPGHPNSRGARLIARAVTAGR